MPGGESHFSKCDSPDEYDLAFPKTAIFCHYLPEVISFDRRNDKKDRLLNGSRSPKSVLGWIQS
jgi:hypothetical protein